MNASSAFTNSEGIATVNLIAPTTSGGALVTAGYGLISANTSVTFTAQPTVGSITLTANPMTIPADGKSTSIITADIRDTANAPVPKGTSITFMTTLGSFINLIKTYTVITPDDTGKVSVSLTSSTTAGSALVIATSNDVSQSIYVGFGGGPVRIVLIPQRPPRSGQTASALPPFRPQSPTRAGPRSPQGPRSPLQQI